MKELWLFAVLLVLAGSLPACARPAVADEVKSDKPRITAPVVSPADIDRLSADNSEFAFRLYGALKDQDGNLFYSPYSISEALAMTYAGARGATASQMAGTMVFTLPPDRLHPAFNAIDQELAKRGQGAQGKDEKGFRLNVVNAIWGQKDFKFQTQYLDTLAENYGAGLRVLDFAGAPEPSRLTINQWVTDKTEQRIKDLIPQGAITSLTRLVLTNAIYFNAAWRSPFPEAATASGPFHKLDGSTVNVPMMKQTASFGYFQGDEFQAVSLPYDGNELAMVLVLPKEGHFKAFETALNGQEIGSILRDLKFQQVALTMPKFGFDASLGLNQTLSDMGMSDAFDPSRADFSGMDGKKDLYITDVIHKAFVAVDEAGTEAAASTAVIVGTTSMPAEPVAVTLDRPFVFFIRDIQTGAILFVGRVLAP